MKHVSPISARSLLVSCVVVLSAACSAVPVKCERDEIPADLLAVPQENQLDAILGIFEDRSSTPEVDAKK